MNIYTTSAATLKLILYLNIEVIDPLNSKLDTLLQLVI